MAKKRQFNEYHKNKYHKGKQLTKEQVFFIIFWLISYSISYV